MSTNRLKKPPPMSATLTMASSPSYQRTATISDASYYPNTNANSSLATAPRFKGAGGDLMVSSTASSTTMTPTNIQPMTANEQYWATRALKAETLLAAHEDHKKEIKNLGYAHDMKRERELVQLAKEHKEKHDALDKLVKFLAGLVVVLIVVIVYLSTHYASHSMLLQYKQQEKWWSMIGASHFTIPILSPFTSVVEHESSVIGSKLIGSLAAIAACLVLLGFRHWLASQTQATSKPGSGMTSALMTRASSAIAPYSIDR